MDPVLLSGISGRPQRFRRRRCLLKDCEQWFVPSHAQCRYCSVACRVAARQWRCWQAQQKYRASRHGRERRQQQACRYRQRWRAASTCAGSGSCAAVTASSARPSAAVDGAAAACPPLPPTCAAGVGGGSTMPCEGKRAGAKMAVFPWCPCDRPGCYVLFAVVAAKAQRRFCCALCRKAMRCVLDREARWRQRRRRGLRPPGRRARRQMRGP
jgi:hypothetical protein